MQRRAGALEKYGTTTPLRALKSSAAMTNAAAAPRTSSVFHASGVPESGSRTVRSAMGIRFSVACDAGDEGRAVDRHPHRHAEGVSPVSEVMEGEVVVPPIEGAS